jgi:hypothetical protein
MITSSNGKATCTGYASFIDERATMRACLEPLHRDLEDAGEEGRKRLTKVQHLSSSS